MPAKGSAGCGPVILVSGAAGFLGRHVVAALRAAGYPVRAMVRDPERARGLEADEVAVADITDPAAVASAARGCRAVVHLVAIRREWRERTFARITVGGTRNLVRAADEAGVERFVYVSALGAAEPPRTAYMRGKHEAERLVREGGIPWVILRPSFIVGPGGFVAEYGHIVRRAPVIPLPGPADYPVQPVAAWDVALACVRALERPEAVRASFDLPGPERVSFKQFVLRIAEALGVRKPVVHVPLAFMRALAWALEPLTPSVPATRDELANLVAGSFGDPDPAVRALDLRLTPLADAVRRAVRELGWV